MTWHIKINDVEFDSDDFLVEDLAEIEKLTGTPWSVSNPLREIKVARAFLAVAMLRSGKGEAEIETALKMLTLKKLKRAFQFVPDTDEEEPAGEDGNDPLELPSSTSRESSLGEPATTGRRVRSVASA